MKLGGITFYQVKNSLEELDIKHDFNNDVRSLEGGLWGELASCGKTSAMLAASRSICVTMFIDATALSICS
jgi:hypothetical protein